MGIMYFYGLSAISVCIILFKCISFSWGWLCYVVWFQAEPAANTSSSTSQTTSGQLSRLQETHNPEEAQEYLGKVANLLLEFSRADTAVKKHMCSTSLLQRLLQMLNTLPPPILIKVPWVCLFFPNSFSFAIFGCFSCYFQTTSVDYS